MKKLAAVAFVVSLSLLSSAPAQQKAYRLKGEDLKQQVIWGATCELPDGTGLAFGGQDQKADDGQPHTRIKVKAQWKAIHKELRYRIFFQKQRDGLAKLIGPLDQIMGRARLIYFKGLPPEEQLAAAKADLIQRLIEWSLDFAQLARAIHAPANTDIRPYEATQADRASQPLFDGVIKGNQLETIANNWSTNGIAAEDLRQLLTIKQAIQMAMDHLDAEPPPRALSPIVYDKKSELFILFGGDHLDYLMNDTWVFDLAKLKWEQRHPKTAPPPRGNHTLKATGDGKVVLSGGYTYTNALGYVSGQYIDHDDGDWTYDIAANTWTGAKEGVAPNQRVYRTGPFHPDFYLQGDKPEAKPFQEKLASLPANTWVSTKPPHLPRLNRDWGSAVLDTDRDMILRFSGGHSAHGGTDVLHYHLASNRWELPFPVEFPLGQLYSNTSYPEGFNFNLRPWVTGHTYQNYGYDPTSKKMLFTGQHEHCYIYDPEIGDWAGRLPKPAGMVYSNCFYTLTCCTTPEGLVCWTQNGRLFRYDPGKKEWAELKLQGKLPGAVVDNSTLLFDSKRNRLLFVAKGYGEKNRFDGRIHTVDLKSLAVGVLEPMGLEAASAIPYLCQLRYDQASDLVLCGCTLPPDETGFRRTPAYDPAANRWVSLKITGDDPSGKGGRNVSLGMMYDPKRKLFWAVDTNSNVFVLRLDPKTADVQPMK